MSMDTNKDILGLPINDWRSLALAARSVRGIYMSQLANKTHSDARWHYDQANIVYLGVTLAIRNGQNDVFLGKAGEKEDEITSAIDTFVPSGRMMADFIDGSRKLLEAHICVESPRAKANTSHGHATTLEKDAYKLFDDAKEIVKLVTALHNNADIILPVRLNQKCIDNILYIVEDEVGRLTSTAQEKILEALTL